MKSMKKKFDLDTSEICCPICLSCYSERGAETPRRLSCGHSHCQKCLQAMFKRNDPKCRDCNTLIVFRDVQMIPINHYILRIKEQMKLDDVSCSEIREINKKCNKIRATMDIIGQSYSNTVIDIAAKRQELQSEIAVLLATRDRLREDKKILVKSTSMEESLAVMNDVKRSLKRLDDENKIFTDRLGKTKELSKLSPLFDHPEGVCIKRGDLRSTCFTLLKKIYMYTMVANMRPADKFELNFSMLRPFLSGAFLIMEYGDRTSLLEFEVFPGNARGQQFLDMCRGGVGLTYEGASFSNHNRVGLEGECVELGFDRAQKSKALSSDFSKSSGTFEGTKWFLEGLGSNRSKGTHFRIFFEDQPSLKSSFFFGKLTRGGSILRSVIKGKFQTKIVKAGLIFDADIKIDHFELRQ